MADLFSPDEEFTDADKLACCERELRFRRRVYATKVAEGRMKPSKAAHEIGVMEAMANDYAARLGIRRNQ